MLKYSMLLSYIFSASRRDVGPYFVVDSSMFFPSTTHPSILRQQNGLITFTNRGVSPHTLHESRQTSQQHE
jgi:hypothetical protein